MSELLCEEEVVRANRFRFAPDRMRFIRCRGALRSLLGKYMDIPANALRFEYSCAGKPDLSAQQNMHGLRFNVSHSDDVALIAVTAKSLVGVDIEKIQPDIEFALLAERFFSLRERASMKRLPLDSHLESFFACWTRKEAFLKARGDGLSFPLSEFSVSTHPDCNPTLEEIRGSTKEAKKWFLKDLSVEGGHRATVAVQDQTATIETYGWN